MRTQPRSSRNSRRPVFDDDYFERKGRELVAPDEEIETWEIDARDFGGLAEDDDYFNTPRSE